MSELFAVRNLRLCTKDCLCLYVCPTGATDTENGQVDWRKCIGCGKCAAACPSGALTMAPKAFPPPQAKDETVAAALTVMAERKAAQRAMSEAVAASSDGAKALLARAAAESTRWMAEDLIREAGYLLPQNRKVAAFLAELIANPPAGFPLEAAKKLLSVIEKECEEREPREKWRCSVCGYVHEGALDDDFTCPRCKQPASVFVKVE